MPFLVAGIVLVCLVFMVLPKQGLQAGAEDKPAAEAATEKAESTISKASATPALNAERTDKPEVAKKPEPQPQPAQQAPAPVAAAQAENGAVENGRAAPPANGTAASAAGPSAAEGAQQVRLFAVKSDAVKYTDYVRSQQCS